MKVDKNIFTYEQYENLLVFTKKHYKFSNYQEFGSTDRSVIWRHDIDFSIQNSLRLAQLESKIGCSCSYFVNLHSEFYNPLQSSEIVRLQEILSLGHEIGIHFDMSHYQVSSDGQLECELLEQVKIFEKYFSVTPKVFSFHNPTSNDLKFNKHDYAGLINTYSEVLQSMPYCSDSNGYWRFKNLSDFLEQNVGNSIQVLTHPGWWQEYDLPPRLRIMQCVTERAKTTLSEYDEILRTSDRSNVTGWESLPKNILDGESSSGFVLDILLTEGEYNLLASCIENKLLGKDTLPELSAIDHGINNYSEFIEWLRSVQGKD